MNCRFIPGCHKDPPPPSGDAQCHRIHRLSTVKLVKIEGNDFSHSNHLEPRSKLRPSKVAPKLRPARFCQHISVLSAKSGQSQLGRHFVETSTRERCGQGGAAECEAGACRIPGRDFLPRSSTVWWAGLLARQSANRRGYRLSSKNPSLLGIALSAKPPVTRNIVRFA